MATESIVAAQIVRLLSQKPAIVWELIEPGEPTREGDVVLYDGEGTPVVYARPTR